MFQRLEKNNGEGCSTKRAGASAVSPHPVGSSAVISSTSMFVNRGIQGQQGQGEEFVHEPLSMLLEVSEKGQSQSGLPPCSCYSHHPPVLPPAAPPGSKPASAFSICPSISRAPRPGGFPSPQMLSAALPEEMQ